jgi:hypothetical protein
LLEDAVIVVADVFVVPDVLVPPVAFEAVLPAPVLADDDLCDGAAVEFPQATGRRTRESAAKRSAKAGNIEWPFDSRRSSGKTIRGRVFAEIR